MTKPDWAWDMANKIPCSTDQVYDPSAVDVATALRKAMATGLRIAAGICDAEDASPVLAATMKALADSIERGEA